MAQQFGRNRVQYQPKDWSYLRSTHFDIYFYQDCEPLARFVVCTAESAYTAISTHFNYRLTDRIPFVVYRSHNDFSETTISSKVVEESVGGFTEFLKSRIIIPFEGSYEKFRHVIHHELTHAVMLQMLYGSGPGAIIQGIMKMQPPLWFIEGLAEFESLGWDTESDMYVRDATLQGYLPPINGLQAFMAYKGGQSVLLYLEDIYGPQKLGELLHRLRHSRNFAKAWEDALNESLEETNRKWQQYMREKYWPEIANRHQPDYYAQPVTDHRKWQNFVNNSPALSPTGDKVAFLTDRSGYFDIYLTSATEPHNYTRLIAGQRKADLEELHWLQPGMSWSPNGKYLVFAARAGNEDALNIIDVQRKKIVHRFRFGLHGLFSPAWSPDSTEIAFVGFKNQQSDIYVFNLQTGELRNITNDIFSDLDPAWSPDGEHIVFASDRKDNVEPVSMRKPVDMVTFDYRTTDIYVVRKNGTAMRRLTTTPQNERSPQYTTGGNIILYVSDRSGVPNIYFQHPDSSKANPLTNLLTGCAQLSWGLNSDRLAFTAFSDGGYDVYVWANPFDFEKESEPPKLTAFMKQKLQGRQIPDVAGATVDTEFMKQHIWSKRDYSTYYFDDRFRRGIVERDKTPIASDSASADSLVAKRYKTRFSLDYIDANAAFDPIFGLQGLTQIYLSDMLGEHQLVLGVNLIQDLQNSDLQLAYFNQRHRLNWGVYGLQAVSLYYTTFGVERFTTHGTGLTMSYPFSRFRRMDLGLQYYHLTEDNLNYRFFPTTTVQLLMPALAIVTDNSLMGYTGPISGRRTYIGLSSSPAIGENSKQFTTLDFDLRSYLAFSHEFSLAFRLAGGASYGRNPTLFIMGGPDNWLNYQYYAYINYASVQEYFFTNYLAPLRGADFYELVGSRACLMNLEFRFPFIQYLVMRTPLPMVFQNIRGVFFWDAGSAWTDTHHWQLFDRTDENERYVRDVVNGFGYGIRVNLGIMLLRFDAAWRTDFLHVSAPKYYFSIGADF